MRLVPIVLLVANLLVAAFLGFEGRSAPGTSDAPRPEIRPKSIRIVGTGKEARTAPSTAVSQEAPREPLLACATWGGFPESQAAVAESRLEPIELGMRLSRVETATTTNYLVVIPPIDLRPELNARVDALKRAGITDQFVINDGDLRNGISLGFFKSEEAANRHLASLQAKGVGDAVVKARPAGSIIVTFHLHDLTAAERTQLETIASGTPNAALKFQPCPSGGAPG